MVESAAGAENVECPLTIDFIIASFAQAEEVFYNTIM